MYIPKHYNGKDKQESIAFMKRFNFGTIITSIDNIPFATHLPFIIAERDNEIIISSHFSKANEHWKHIESNESLIIFSEPHAYISPKNYVKQENVPTWNYISVHAYGKAKIKGNPKEVTEMLEHMMDDFDPDYKKQWNSISDDYKTRMAKGIVAFEVQVSKLQSKEKLSQNKMETERKSIIKSLSKSKTTNEKIISEYMKLNELNTTKPKRH